MCLGKIVADLEVFLSVSFIFRRTDSRNHLVQDGNDTDKPLNDVQALLCLFLVKARARNDDVLAVCDVAGPHSKQAHLTTRVVVDSYHVEVIVDLQVGVFEQVVEDSFLVSVLFKLNRNAKPCTVGLITHFCNTRYLIVEANLINFFHQRSFIDLVRNLGYDNLRFTTL